MRNNFLGFNLDFLGFSASMLCAVHCSILPILLTIGAFSGLAWMQEPVVEFVFIGLSIVFASWSLVTSYLKHHNQFSPIVVVFTGFLLIILSRFVEGAGEAIFTSVGGFTIAVAHVINWRLLRKFHQCLTTF